ncbi:MAG: hypothetical protein ACREOZ_04190 [Gloeomargaritales cyanobacterium]
MQEYAEKRRASLGSDDAHLMPEGIADTSENITYIVGQLDLFAVNKGNRSLDWLSKNFPSYEDLFL